MKLNKNILDSIAQFENIIGYRFNNKEYILEALTHSYNPLKMLMENFARHDNSKIMEGENEYLFLLMLLKQL